MGTATSDQNDWQMLQNILKYSEKEIIEQFSNKKLPPNIMQFIPYLQCYLLLSKLHWLLNVFLIPGFDIYVSYYKDVLISNPNLCLGLITMHRHGKWMKGQLEIWSTWWRPALSSALLLSTMSASPLLVVDFTPMPHCFYNMRLKATDQR